MWLMIAGWIIVVLLILWCVWGALSDHGGQATWGAILGICMGLFMLITSIAIPLDNQNRLQEMSAFCEANAENYGSAVEETRIILSEQEFHEALIELIGIEGSIEKFKLGDTVARRILEWRESVVLYNIDLARFRYFDKHPLVGYYFPTPPQKLKYLMLGD